MKKKRKESPIKTHTVAIAAVLMEVLLAIIIWSAVLWAIG